MKIRIHLGDADRQRLGVTDDLEVDPRTITMRETIILQKGVEIGNGASAYDSVSHWLGALKEGAWQEPFAYLVLLWLALRRSGIDLPLAEVDASLANMQLEFLSEATDPEQPGKGRPTRATTSSSRRTSRS